MENGAISHQDFHVAIRLFHLLPDVSLLLVARSVSDDICCPTHVHMYVCMSGCVWVLCT